MKMSILRAGFPRSSGNRWKEVCKNKSNDLEVFLRLLRIVGTQGESMRAMSKTVLAVALLATSAFFAASVSATTIRSASGYGTGESISQCQAATGNCEGFQLAPIQVNGIWYNGADFFFRTPTDLNNNFIAGQLDIIDIGQVSSGGSFFLPLVSPNLLFLNSDGSSTDLLATGVFSCSTDPNDTTASSSTGPMLGLPCMGGGDDPSLVNELIQSNGITFTFSGDISNLVLFTEEGNVSTGSSVATPEPASLTLLGTGLAILLGGKLRRRKQA